MQRRAVPIGRILTCLLALAPGLLSAQSTSKNDSLQRVFEQDTSSTARIGAGILLSNATVTSDPIRTVEVAGRVLQLVDSLQKAHRMTDSLADITRIDLLESMGIAYTNLGDVDQELQLALQNLGIAERLGNPQKLCMTLEKVGVLQLRQGHREEAYTYFHRALAMAERSNNTYRLAMELGNIGAALGDTDPDSMLWYFRRSLEVMQRPDMRDQEGAMGWMLNNIGEVMEARGELDTALSYYDRSLAIRRSIDHRLGQYLVHGDIAELLLKEGRPREALVHADASIAIARENGFHRNLDQSYKVRSRILARLGRYAEAYRDHLHYVQERDSVLNERQTKKVVQQTMRYEYGRKMLADSLAFEKERALQALDNQLAQEKIKRTRNIYLFSGLGVLLVAGGLWGRLRYTHRAKVAIEKEKKVSEQLLLNILPEEVAEELKEKGEAEAKLIDQVTVLFTDFKGFTAMSEQLTPKDLVKDLNECFSAFDRIVEKHGIEKIKTIGDAYMAAGGLPVPNTTHALDVIQAALEMRDFIAEGKARKIAADLPYFEIRIGIHTGPVVAGIVGVKKFQYDIWGDTVNTASRMESSGEVGQVNISEATYALMKDAPGLSFTPRGKVQAKGKGEMEMYFVNDRTV